jgi:outer membrane protein OmpA-like peptidoglycan-associated protein
MAFATRGPEPLPQATLTKGRIILREPVQFVEDREDLAETSAPAIAEVATLLRSHPEIALLRIEVHTDDDGAPDDLLALSRRRANAIRSRLVRAGVAAGRLEARGYGDTRPLTTNYSARDRAINRRVELVVARTVPAPR